MELNTATYGSAQTDLSALLILQMPGCQTARFHLPTFRIILLRVSGMILMGRQLVKFITNKKQRNLLFSMITGRDTIQEQVLSPGSL